VLGSEQLRLPRLHDRPAVQVDGRNPVMNSVVQQTNRRVDKAIDPKEPSGDNGVGLAGVSAHSTNRLVTRIDRDRRPSTSGVPGQRPPPAARPHQSVSLWRGKYRRACRHLPRRRQSRRMAASSADTVIPCP